MEAPEGFRAVRHAGIVRFVPLESPHPVEKPVHIGARTSRTVRASGHCQDCGRRVWRRSRRCIPCHRLMVAELAQERAAVKETREHLSTILERNLAHGRPTVCECGCLILPHELCPACVIPWMRANGHSPDVIYYQTQTIEERRAA